MSSHRVSWLALLALVTSVPARGQRVGPELLVNAGGTAPTFAGVHANATGSFLVSWNDHSAALFQRFDAAGLKSGPETSANQTTPALNGRMASYPNGEFVACWEQGSPTDIYFRRFSSAGVPLASAAVANEVTDDSQSSPRVAALGTRGSVIAWSAPSPPPPGASTVWARRFDPSGLPMSRDLAVGADPTFCLAGSSNGSFAILQQSFSTAVGQLYASDGTPIGTQLEVGAITAPARPSAALDGNGGLLVAFRAPDASDAAGIQARLFDANGSPRGNAFVVNTHTTGAQGNPSVALDPAGNFVVAWDGEGPGGVNGIWAQRFDAAASRVGPLLQVNTTPGAPLEPSVAYVAGGTGFVIVWRQSSTVYGQRFVVHGELNGDGRIDLFDLLALASYIVGNVTPGNPPFLGSAAGADVNRDGTVDLFDLLLLAGYIVGNVPALPT